VDLPDRQSLVFIGFMGAGKTTAADVTAEALGTNATDVDDVVARRLGRSIDKVFDDDGEARFRAVEEQATLELLDAPEQRVSTSTLPGPEPETQAARSHGTARSSSNYTLTASPSTPRSRTRSSLPNASTRCPRSSKR
jgi:shikimate kinase